MTAFLEVPLIAMRMETVNTSETWASFFESTRRNISECSQIHYRHRTLNPNFRYHCDFCGVRFVCSLFNDAFSVTVYVESNKGAISEK
jgi:hypothetical protein